MQASTTNETIWETSIFAGNCTNRGDIDGNLLEAKFSPPASIILFKNWIYMSDWKNNKIKEIDLISDQVKTVYLSKYQLAFLAVGAKEKEFYATADHGILHIYNHSENWLTGSAPYSAANSNNDIGIAEFHQPRDMHWLTNSTLLVADELSSKLKVVDTITLTVKNICTGEATGFN